MKKYAASHSALIVFIGLVLFLFVVNGAAAAQTGLTMDINQSVYLDEQSEITRVAIANPAIADVTVISKTEFLVVAKKEGTTSLYVWTAGGSHQEYSVNVREYDSNTAAAITQMIGEPGVKVEKIGDKILLKGTVENQFVKKRAEKIAELYGTKVVNLLEMSHPTQIRIEAKILEIATDKVKRLGIQYANASDIDKDNGIVTIGPTGIFGFGQTFSNRRDSTTSKLGGYADINATLQALITQGDARILSQPSMVTMSGEQANILIGGEIPIPTTNTNGQISVEWREYGIKLHIEPQVDEKNTITSKVNAEVSTLDSSSSAAINLSGGLSIPALRSRKAETVIHLSSGSTMAIGGLVSSEEGKQVIKVPFLGELPILGKFFRSTATSKEKKEIIILITPTLVDETTPPVMSQDMQEMLEKQEDKAGGK